MIRRDKAAYSEARRANGRIPWRPRRNCNKWIRAARVPNELLGLPYTDHADDLVWGAVAGGGHTPPQGRDSGRQGHRRAARSEYRVVPDGGVARSGDVELPGCPGAVAGACAAWGGPRCVRGANAGQRGGISFLAHADFRGPASSLPLEF